MNTRQPLSEQRIVEAAASVADRDGLAAISMRRVGRELGVEAMSLYHHVANKEALLDALGDWVFAQIELPMPDDGWSEGMRRRAASARRVLVDHPWALGLVDSRPHAGPAVLRHHDAVIGCLRRNGFTVADAARAFSLIDAYVYGFALTERNLPFDAEGAGAEELAVELLPQMADYSYLAELASEVTAGGDYAFADEFENGLDLILEALAPFAAPAPGTPAH